MDISQAERAAAAVETDAQRLGPGDGGTAADPSPGTGIGTAVPVLRVQDAEVALAFYRDALGFGQLWEHRFEPGLPLYTRIRRGGATIDLSEHFGDGTPGTVLWIPVEDVRALRAELLPRLAPRQRPGLEEDAPGGPTMTVLDPFGNALRFCQPAG